VNISSHQLTPFVTNCFVVEDQGEALVIDPGEASPGLLDQVEDLDVVLIVNTHAHIDHCGGNQALVEATGAPLACHEADLPLLRSLEQQAAMFGVGAGASPEPDRLLWDGDTITVGRQAFEVRHTPGHAPGHVVLVGGGVIFAGDVLFRGSIGRTDLLGGNHEQLLESIRERLLDLSDETIVYAGHGPGTTIGRERTGNPYLVGL